MICKKCEIDKAETEFYQKNKQCKKCVDEVHRKWMKKNKEKVLAYDKKKREKNREKVRRSSRDHYHSNKEKCLARSMKWKEDNKDKVLEYKRAWVKEKRKTDPMFRLSKNTSSAVYKAIKSNKDNRKWQKLTGYTLKEMVRHLESQFKSGMDWDNYGDWHVDHIRPVSSFNFTKPEDEEFKQCWALSNLQPLWAKDNLSKGSKWVA